MFFGVFNFFQKNQRKQVNLWYHSSKVEFVCSFFGRNVSLKKSFRICLTFKIERDCIGSEFFFFYLKAQIFVCKVWTLFLSYFFGSHLTPAMIWCNIFTKTNLNYIWTSILNFKRWVDDISEYLLFFEKKFEYMHTWFFVLCNQKILKGI